MRNCLATLLACCTLICSAAAQVTAIRTGKLIDSDSGTVLSGEIILIRDGKIQAVGQNVAIPSAAKVIDLTNMTVLPGLIDCHTHLVFAGDRAGEFERRLAGESYEAILFVVILGAAPSIASGLITGVDYTPPRMARATPIP